MQAKEIQKTCDSDYSESASRLDFSFICHVGDHKLSYGQ